MCRPFSRRWISSSFIPWPLTSIFLSSMILSQSSLTRSAIDSEPQTASSADSSSFISRACFGIVKRLSALERRLSAPSKHVGEAGRLPCAATLCPGDVTDGNCKLIPVL